MAHRNSDDFPSERNLNLFWDFPWRTVSHNQMVVALIPMKIHENSLVDHRFLPSYFHYNVGKTW